MIQLTCSHCGKSLQVPEEHSGKSGTCRYCQGKVVVPLIGDTPAMDNAVRSPEVCRGATIGKARSTLYYRVAAVAIIMAMLGATIGIYLGMPGVQQGNDSMLAPEEELAEERNTSLTLLQYGILSDSRTGLEWFQLDNDPVPFDEAKDLVERLSIAGGGWRLPTMDEVAALARGAGGGRSDFVWTTDVASPERRETIRREMGTQAESLLIGPEGHMRMAMPLRKSRTLIDLETNYVAAVRRAK